MTEQFDQDQKATQSDLTAWYEMQEKLRVLKADEMTLRKKIVASYFPAPTEGTNSAPLADGWVLKMTQPVTRGIDIAVLETMSAEFQEKGISISMLIDWKPSLKVSVYKELEEEQRHLFDQVLVIKPGSPSLKIEMPKRNAK